MFGVLSFVYITLFVHDHDHVNQVFSPGASPGRTGYALLRGLQRGGKGKTDGCLGSSHSSEGVHGSSSQEPGNFHVREAEMSTG